MARKAVLSILIAQALGCGIIADLHKSDVPARDAAMDTEDVDLDPDMRDQDIFPWDVDARDVDARDADMLDGDREEIVPDEGPEDIAEAEEADAADAEDAADAAEEEVAWECILDIDCTDHNMCNGEETCNPVTHECESGAAPPEGTECQASPRRICRRGACVASTCGDGFIDTEGGEECEGTGDRACSFDGCSGIQSCSSCHWTACDLGPAPANDACSGAVDVSSGGDFRGSTCGAYNDYSGSCGGGGGVDVAYILEITELSDVTVDTCTGTYMDTVLYIFSGDCTGSEIACNDDSCGLGSSINVTLDPGTYYIIMDLLSDTESGEFNLSVEITPTPP
jgi:hypothetical protein